MLHRESLEQRAFVQWCRYHPIARVIFAIPNGGRRSKIEASILKAEGVRPGVPDLFLPVARCNAHGLFVEMKAEDGRESKDQTEYADQLASNGYAVVFAWMVDAAILGTEQYLAGTMPAGVWRIKKTV